MKHISSLKASVVIADGEYTSGSYQDSVVIANGEYTSRSYQVVVADGKYTSGSYQASVVIANGEYTSRSYQVVVAGGEYTSGSCLRELPRLCCTKVPRDLKGRKMFTKNVVLTILIKTKRRHRFL